MAVSSVTSSFASYASQVVSGGGGGKSPSATSAQEANETLAQTTKEANGGDRVAKAKLAKIQAAKTAQVTNQSAPASEPGKGTVIDKAA